MIEGTQHFVLAGDGQSENAATGAGGAGSIQHTGRLPHIGQKKQRYIQRIGIAAVMPHAFAHVVDAASGGFDVEREW